LKIVETARKWVIDRMGLGRLAESLLYRRVAKSPWYQGDGTALLLLVGVQVVTGAFMTLIYSTSPDRAFQSVEYITRIQPMGWFIRGLHYWSAGITMVMLAVHLFRQIMLAGYKSPREGTWFVGLGLMVGLVVMSFTGYVLRWDERAVYAIRVALNMFYRVPWIGEELVLLVQGGPSLSSHTLSRFYSVHVVFTPMLLVALVGYHLYLVVLYGTTSMLERQGPVHSAEHQKELYGEQKESEQLGEPFFPKTMADTGIMALAVFLVPLAFTLVIGPRELGTQANLTSVAFPAEEWWYAWYSGLIALFPGWLAPIFFVAFPAGILLLLVLLPLLDRGPYRGYKHRPVFATAALLAFASILFLSDLRARSPWTAWPSNDPPPVPHGIKLTAEVEKGRQLFVKYGCNSCHAVAGFGRKVGPDLAGHDRSLSADEIQGFILRPPAHSSMPSYEGRMSKEDLERVTSFVHVTQALFHAK